MEEDKRSEELKEAIARYIGFPIGELEEPIKPMTEEQRRKWEEFMQRTQNLSKEEFQKMFFGDQDESTSTEQDK